MDILDADQCARVIGKVCPDAVLHAAGYVNAAKAEIEKEKCFKVNVEGSRNVFRAAKGLRLIYISTDYVFDGESGRYVETDRPSPVNWYGFTKQLGEVVSLECGALILRAPFRDNPPWKNERALADQWTSGDFVSVRAPQIVQALRLQGSGILHIGGERRSILALARMATPGIRPMLRREAPLPLPRDTSLDSSKWKSLIEASRQSSPRVGMSLSAAS
jgi:dTDP-4-dehydrorhamnose reductase